VLPVTTRGGRGPGGMNSDPDVQQPLMLVMPLILETVPLLRQALGALDERELSLALDTVGTVHSTRFVILEDEDHAWAKLIVVAIFDGTVEDYIAAFARALNTQFNLLFGFVAETDDKPITPVKDNVERFTQYVKNRNVAPVSGRSYSAYPNLTALDIYEAARSHG
jgi:hypothetical protein